MAATFIGWDWKGNPTPEDLNDALKPFGLHVYEDPTSEGSDWFGYIISDKALDKAELAVVAESQYEGSEDEDEDEDEYFAVAGGTAETAGGTIDPVPDLTANFLTRHYLIDPSEYRQAPEAALKAVGEFDGSYNSALIGKHPKKGYFVVEAGDRDGHEEIVWSEWDNE